MKGTYYFLIKPLHDRYKNTKQVGDKELIVNTEVFNHQYVSREAIVVGLPSEFKTEIKEGDQVVIHHNVFRRWHNIKGEEKNSSSYVLEDLYKVSIDQIFAYKRNDNWKALDKYSFIQPIQNEDGGEEPGVGLVKHSNEFAVGDLVGYKPSGEYEFIIDGKRLYRVLNIFITVKYEHKGEEKEYNPSWVQSS